MVHRGTWHRNIEEITVPQHVAQLGKALEYQGLRVSKGVVLIYRVVGEDGGIRTVLDTSGAALLDSRNVGVLCALLLEGCYAPDMGHEKYVEAPSESAKEAEAAKKAAEEVRRARDGRLFDLVDVGKKGWRAPAPLFDLGLDVIKPWRLTPEMERAMVQAMFPGGLNVDDDRWLREHSASAEFTNNTNSTGKRMVTLTFTLLCGEGNARIHGARLRVKDDTFRQALLTAKAVHEQLSRTLV